VTPITLTEIIYGFSQSLQAHAGLLPEIRSWLFLFQFISHSSLYRVTLQSELLTVPWRKPAVFNLMVLTTRLWSSPPHTRAHTHRAEQE